MSKISELKDRLREQEAYYASACVQLSALNIQMEQLAKRFERAEEKGQKSFRYSLRMRMAVLEGVRNMFYEFASLKANVISRLRHEILIEHVFSEANMADLNDSYPIFGRYGLPLFMVGNNNEDEEEDGELDEEEEDDYLTETDEELPRERRRGNYYILSEYYLILYSLLELGVSDI
ncbi:hypothetical protein FSP39_006851 [Pinctada imbricata]|uniref:Uncharacterized protein n=1 Tax=Pinctada imbricata TaxID=66713 RepID=A0AA89C4U2_PINIB|nr:hypothetical protein FSP39_006851 [Pinctada imbricata]